LEEKKMRGMAIELKGLDELQEDLAKTEEKLAWCEKGLNSNEKYLRSEKLFSEALSFKCWYAPFVFFESHRRQGSTKERIALFQEAIDEQMRKKASLEAHFKELNEREREAPAQLTY
jgi:septal ring factor EnvC (AmiA/AmiB activator)